MLNAIYRTFFAYITTLVRYAKNVYQAASGVEWTFGVRKKRRQEMRDHIGPVFGDKRLTDIESHDVRALQLALLAKKTARGDKTLAPQTVNNIVSTISARYRHGVEMDIVSSNPCESIKGL